jgi:hypothetical protein
MTIRTLDENEISALTRFSDAHGKKWKRVLAEVYWYNARMWRDGEANDGPILHGLRNDPNWSFHGLTAYKSTKV